MEENLMDDVVETADHVVTVTEMLPGYSTRQVGIVAGVSFVAGVIACKVAKPVWRKIDGVFRKYKVTKKLQGCRGLTFEDMDNQKTE